MPRSNYTAQEFLVELPNLVKAGTDVKRKAIVRFLDVNWENKYVRIAVRTIYFAKNVDGTYGDEIKSMGRPEVYITASNQWVDETTGELLRNEDGSFMTEDQIKAKEQQTGTPISYNYEFDWFDMIAKTVLTISINQMIQNYVNSAYASGKYDV